MLSCLLPWGSTAPALPPKSEPSSPPASPQPLPGGGLRSRGLSWPPWAFPSPKSAHPGGQSPLSLCRTNSGGTRSPPPSHTGTEGLAGVPSIPGWAGGRLPSVLLQPPAFPGTLSGLWPPSPQPCGLQGTPTGTFQVILAGLHRCGAGPGGRGLATGVDPRTLDSPACWPGSLASPGISLGAGIRLECGSQANGRESPT